MTNKEAIEYNKNLRMYMQITDKKSEHKFLKENYTALDMAIKALEQEQFINKSCVSSGVCEHDKNNVLDKIRAEIEFEVDHRTNMLCAEDVFGIIDKYRREV